MCINKCVLMCIKCVLTDLSFWRFSILLCLFRKLNILPPLFKLSSRYVAILKLFVGIIYKNIYWLFRLNAKMESFIIIFASTIFGKIYLVKSKLKNKFLPLPLYNKCWGTSTPILNNYKERYETTLMWHMQHWLWRNSVIYLLSSEKDFCQRLPYFLKNGASDSSTDVRW